MRETEKLIEYAELCGHSMWPNGDKLMVCDGKNLSSRLEQLITIHKEDILLYLNNNCV